MGKLIRTIVVVGAGGKMGCRLTDNFMKTDYAVHYAEKGIANLQSRGLEISAAADVVPQADVVILAVRDVAIGAVAAATVPIMRPGSLLMPLDASILRVVIDDSGYELSLDTITGSLKCPEMLSVDISD